jgi:hypothetical protein
MPRRSILCTQCGRKRVSGGQSKTNGLCRLCWHDARMALPASERKRGPYRKGYAAKAVRKAKPKAVRVRKVQPFIEPKALGPDASWWAGCRRDEWGQRIEEQMPRFRAAGIGKDRPPIGMSATTL